MAVKDSNRKQSEGLESLRDETMSAKAELDSLNLVLQNLLYEKSHYEKEIRTCEDFKWVPLAYLQAPGPSWRFVPRGRRSRDAPCDA